MPRSTVSWIGKGDSRRTSSGSIKGKTTDGQLNCSRAINDDELITCVRVKTRVEHVHGFVREVYWTRAGDDTTIKANDGRCR